MKHFRSGIYFIFLFAIILLGSCEKDCGESDPVNDPVYFQYEATNYAWGYYHAGWYVDQLGNFNYYIFPGDWNEPDSLGFISKDDLLSNLQKVDSVIYHISIDALQNQISLIDQVDGDSFSNLQLIGADIGRLELFCFKWDASRSKYKRTLLAYSGDFAQHNLDPEAQELTAWLIAVGENSGFFSWF